jgi:hypothetical protein
LIKSKIPNNRRKVTSLTHLWKKQQSILNSFWKRWSTNNLVEQQERRKWKNQSTENLLDKIVLIQEDDKLSRNVWKIGRIIQVHPSKDGLIRNVTVKTASQNLKIPVQKLAILENY